MRVPMLAIHPRPIAARPYDIVADVRGPVPKCSTPGELLELQPPEVRREMEEAIVLAEHLTSHELRLLVRRHHDRQRALAKTKLSAAERARVEEQWAADNLSGREWTRWFRMKRC